MSAMTALPGSAVAGSTVMIVCASTMAPVGGAEMSERHHPAAVAGRRAVDAAALLKFVGLAPIMLAPRMFAAVAFAALVLAAGAARAQSDTTLRSVTMPEIRRLEAQSAQRTDAQKKLSSQLIDAGRPPAPGAVMPGLPALRSAPLDTQGARTLVDIDAEVDDALLAAIRAAGGSVVNAHPEERAVRAYVPADRIESLAADRRVNFITPADKAMTQAMPVDQEGVVAHLADRARELFNVDGSGIRIGILSDSLDNGRNALEQAYQTGAIDRGRVQTLSGQDGKGEGEGLAMAEIVHAIAPGASIHFATATGGAAQMAANIRALQALGCDIIIDDMSYASEPPFQDGPISRAVSYVTSRGVLYFSAAGNSGNKRQNTSSTWEGDFADGGTVPDLPGAPQRFHAFAPGKVVNWVRDKESGWVGLFWADPLRAATNQYNLYVIDADGHVLQSGTSSHTGSQPPSQILDGVKPGQGLVVTRNVDARPLFLRVETPRAALTVATAGNIKGHSASTAKNAFSVAAIPVADPPEAFTASLTAAVAWYSADGPRRVFFNPDGTPITPGNLSSLGGRSFVKPDIAAADLVKTSVPGFQPFKGTSAAAPHAGAVAALVMSYDRSLTADEVGDIMLRTALPVDGGPQGGTAGRGVVTALAALRSACRQRAATHPLCPDAAEPVMTSSGTSPLNSSARAVPGAGDAETTRMLLK